MKERHIVLFTMEGCPFCEILKEELKKVNVEFIDRDINEFVEEYELFKESVDGNEFVPGFMVIESDGQTHEALTFAPERDFDSIEKGVELIKEYYEKPIV
jgi:glutaredoxin